MPATRLDILTLLADGVRWGLPTNFSVHGERVDHLLAIIFWVTLAAFVAVQLTLVWFLVRYRHRGGRPAAMYVHGHRGIEIGWTVVPAFLLLALALGSKAVWDDYTRPGSALDAPEPARAMVIGQQFKWNVIYPGPDGRLGRYLMFPRPTDRRWPTGERFRGTTGPAELTPAKAAEAIAAYVDQVNPLGKDFSDPAGLDDDYRDALARDLELPAGRPAEVALGSRDVIHGFFLPNFRVKMDAVPGMIGTVRFTPTATSAAAGGPGYFDIVCSELCGSGHYTMQGRLVVLEAKAYEAKYGLRPAGMGG